MKGISKSKGSEISIIYSDMRGVDFSSENDAGGRKRFAYLENMYRDYDGNGENLIESIPGFRRILQMGKPINGLFRQSCYNGEDYLIIHAGTSVYRLPLDNLDYSAAYGLSSTINNKKSHALQSGEDLLLLDGEKMHYITAKGKLYTVGVDKDAPIYVPTTYLNGERYEQRNLLSEDFIHKYYLDSPDKYSYGTEGLSYEITDEDAKECKVIGYTGNSEDVYIPSAVSISNKTYRISAIAGYSFDKCLTVKRLFVSEGTRYVGKLAFRGCTSLTDVYLPNSVTEIDNGAFSTCTSLSFLHLGLGLERMGDSMLSQCYGLTKLNYAGTEEDFSRIENTSVIGTKTVEYESKYQFGRLKLKIYSPSYEITSVNFEGISEPSAFSAVMKGDIVDFITVDYTDKSSLYGKEITIRGKLSSRSRDHKKEGGFLASELMEDEEYLPELLGKCTVLESFDGKIFISGSKRFPNTVFYTARNLTGKNDPLYFGDMNYFNDGVGGNLTVDMLSTSDGLVVFKDGDDGCGSIYYHTAKETGIDLIPKIYPISYVHSGVVAYGGAVSFFDDPVFLSPHGVTALDKRQINLDRSLAVRSHNVNTKLLCEDLKNASVAVWQGYLAISSGGRMYLADSRATFTHKTGFKEYEWFFLNGIGTYSGDSPLYRYSDQPHSKFLTVEELRHNTPVTTPVYSSSYGYYTKEGDKSFSVYPSGEYIGGKFEPLSVMISIGERLIFGTKNGDICLFNNDKRGIPPDHISREEDFDIELYKANMGRRIHSSYYSFANHSPTYALKTPYDNGDIPHMQKRSIKKSLTLKCRADGAQNLICEVGTDTSLYREICRFPGTEMTFSDLDFSSASLSTQESFTVPISEKEKGWVEKQINIYSQGYNAPIGIYGIAYRFTITGRVKTKIYKQ